MISLTGEYALRAMIFLARHREEWPIAATRIAEEAGIPRKYLSTILAVLVRAGLLEGAPGKSGGFRMTRPARAIRLADVVHPFQSVKFRRETCPFGNEDCRDTKPCGAHKRWKALKVAVDEFLTDTTLQSVAVRDGRRDHRAVRSRSTR